MMQEAARRRMRFSPPASRARDWCGDSRALV